MSAVVITTAGPAVAAESGVRPGTTSGASVAQTGWWWKANDAPTDTSGVAAPPETPAPQVPEGALPSAAAAGDPEKVSAIGFTLDSGPGATVRSFQLSLRERSEPAASVNADAATTKVVACQVTDAFWIGGPAGRWPSQPEYDCDLGSAAGKRSSTGVWQFDLTSMAGAWLAKDSATPPAIVLVEDVEAPESFQVAFDGTAKGVGLKLDASGGAPPPPPVSAPGVGGDAGLGSGGGTGSLPGDSGVPADAGAVPESAPIGKDVPAAAGTPGGGTPEAAPQAAAAGQAPQLVGLFEDLPGGALVLLPLALGMAYLIMFALGPNGEPAPASARHGVGRALDRLRAISTSAKETR